MGVRDKMMVYLPVTWSRGVGEQKVRSREMGVVREMGPCFRLQNFSFLSARIWTFTDITDGKVS